MLCTQIISEYERQTELLERIVQELEKLNACTTRKEQENFPGENSSLQTRERSLDISKRLLSVEETAEYLGMGRQTLYNRTSRKSKNPFPVKPKRMGGSVKFDRQELEAYIASL
jgi:predicted DNA-binding transcriptional regulator AlpA